MDKTKSKKPKPAPKRLKPVPGDKEKLVSEPRAVVIACDVKDSLPLNKLEPLQGELKSLSKVDYERLKKEILDTGFAFPVLIWVSPEKKKNFIIGGHQRVRVLTEMKKEGFAIPPVPVVRIKARSIKEAKRRILQDVSQYGKVEDEGLYKFMIDEGFDIADVMSSFSIPDLDILKFNENFFADTSSTGETVYTKKIKAPTYEPKGEKPKLSELYKLSKLNDLLAEIEVSELPDDEKEFLKYAASRHIQFNYEKVAEFYAHASPELKNLMEKSALVIIDFNKAIENGFVELTEKIAQAYDDEENNEQEKT